LEIFNMKKTLVALAAVAATGGAMAQAVMTGYIAFGYESATSSTNATTSGMGMDDAEINFAIAETIDGVGKLSATMGFTNGGKNNAAVGNDATIKLTTDSGTAFTMGTTKGASYLTGGLAAVAPAGVGATVGRARKTRNRSAAAVSSAEVLPRARAAVAQAAGAGNLPLQRPSPPPDAFRAASLECCAATPL
jgi:hypothetical protein